MHALGKGKEVCVFFVSSYRGFSGGLGDGEIRGFLSRRREVCDLEGF